MDSPLSRHRVLIAVDLPQAPRARLATFFELHEIPGAPCGREAASLALKDKVGILVDARWRVDSALLADAPLLRAIASTEDDPRNVDLDALTRAGVRVTHTPARPARSLLDTAWERVEAAVRRAPGRWAQDGRAHRLRPGAVRLGAPVRGCAIAFEGRGTLHEQLLTHAQAQGVRVLAPGEAAPTDLVVRTLPVEGPLHSGEALDLSDLATRLDGPASHAMSGVDPMLVTAEGLVAALGFGRHAWHPLYWLNPEVGCMTCC